MGCYSNMEKRTKMKLLSCEYNIDTCRVELKFSDGSMIAVDCIAVECEYADNMIQRSALDYLILMPPLSTLICCFVVDWRII